MIRPLVRATQRLSRRRGGDTGAGTLEYIGMTVLVAGLVVVLLLTGMGPRLANSFSSAVCQVLQMDTCPTLDAASGNPGVSTLTPLERATQGKYVAMGDSYSSGEGAKHYLKGTNFDDRDDLWPFNDGQEAHNRCRRSQNAYSQVIKDRFDFKGGSTFVACSGATVRDLTDPNNSNTGESPQLDAVDKDTSLVTLSIGGNDLGFADVVKACILNGSGGLPGMSKCQDEYEPKMAGRLADLRTKLLAQYKAIKDKAPNARLVIMGYPHLFVEKPDDSIGNLLFAEDQVWMNAKGDQLNTMLRRVSEEAGVEFVDPTNAFRGHELGSDDPWINGLGFGGPGMMLVDPGSFHPTSQGQAVMAGLMSDQIEKPK